jgi:hypothetical protein
MIFRLVLKLEISYRTMISWRILVSFRGFFWRLYFCMVKYFNFHNFFCLQILFNVNGNATVTHPLFFLIFIFVYKYIRIFFYEWLQFSLNPAFQFLAHFSYCSWWRHTFNFSNWCILILCVYKGIFICTESSANYITISHVTNSFHMTDF